jgi:hypothetical protein
MVRRWGMIAGVILMLAMVLPAVAQDKDNKDAAKAPGKAVGFYKLDLAVREMDGGKVVNTRSYTINQKGDDWGRFRVGSRVPVQATGIDAQWIDIGLNADCHIVESDQGPTLMWTIDLSSVAPESANTGRPVIRNVRTQGQTILSFSKPIVLSSSDDLNSTHKFVFEMTATKIN